MNIFHLYKSKKYLGRIIVSFSILILLLLALFSSALYYNSEKIVLDMQREANKKVLSQIKFNVTYLNDVIQKLVTSLYYDNDVIPLMTATDNSDVFEMLRKRSRIDKFADYTPFIHSIIIYNANTDQFVWGGDPVLQDRDAPIYAALREMFKAGKPIPKLKMLPMSLDGQEGGKADFFSIFNYDSIVYQPGQSAFILNIKPQWLFDNIKLINQLAWEENENVFIMSDDGSVITPDTDTPELTGDFRQAIMDRIDAATRADDGSGAFNYSISDKKKIVNYLNTGINGWTLVSIQPYETLVKKAESLKNTSIVLTLIFVLLSLLTILGVSHRLYRPLGKLVSFIRGDAGGEAETEPPGGDELTYMSSVYEQTIQRLKAARSEQHTTRSIVRSYYIRKIVTDSQALSREQLLEWIQQHKLAMNPAGPYMLSVMKLDGSTDSANSGDEKERSLLHFAIANIAQEMLSRTYLCEAVEMKSEHLVAVISTRDEAELTETGVRGVMSQIQDAIARMYRVKFSAALGEVIADYAPLHDQYLGCLQLLRYKLVYGGQSILVPSMIKENASQTEASLPPELEKKLMESMKSLQPEAFRKTLDRIFEYISTLNYDYMVYMALHVFILMKNGIKEMNDNRIVPVTIQMSDIDRKIMDSDSLEGMKNILLDVYREINVNKKNPEQERNEILVETVKAVIEQNYSDISLSLQKIGDVMKLSPDYIGKLFKKQLGIAVSEYINEVRLRQAVLYLEEDNYTINELIDKIGFGTRSNFFRLFKNKYGTTPKDYRIKNSLSVDK